MPHITYTKELVGEAVRNSNSWAEAMRFFKPNYHSTTGAQSHLKRMADKFGIDSSHFTGQAWRKNKKFVPKRTLEDYFSNEYPIKSSDLKKRLLSEGYKNKQCECCKLTTWLDGEIPLELHHIDCDHFNNSLENLLIVCSNCHSYLHKSKSVT